MINVCRWSLLSGTLANPCSEAYIPDGVVDVAYSVTEETCSARDTQTKRGTCMLNLIGIKYETKSLYDRTTCNNQ